MMPEDDDGLCVREFDTVRVVAQLDPAHPSVAAPAAVVRNRLSRTVERGSGMMGGDQREGDKAIFN